MYGCDNQTTSHRYLPHIGVGGLLAGIQWHIPYYRYPRYLLEQTPFIENIRQKRLTSCCRSLTSFRQRLTLFSRRQTLFAQRLSFLSDAYSISVEADSNFVDKASGKLEADSTDVVVAKK